MDKITERFTVFVLGHLHLLVFGFPLSNNTLSLNVTYTMESNYSAETNLIMEQSSEIEFNLPTATNWTEQNSPPPSTTTTMLTADSNSASLNNWTTDSNSNSTSHSNWTIDSNFTADTNWTTDYNLTTNTEQTIDSNLTIDTNWTVDSNLSMDTDKHWTDTTVNWTTDSNLTMDTSWEVESNLTVANQWPTNSKLVVEANWTTPSPVSTTQYSFPFDITDFTMPCGEPSSAEELFEDDIPLNTSCDNIGISCELTRVVIQTHNRSHPGAMASCMNPTMPVLRDTTVPLKHCTSGNHGLAHKAVISLHTVSHYMKNLSEVSNSYNFDTQEYTKFYDRIVKNMKGLSCSLTCHNIGLNEADVIAFVRSQLEFISTTLPNNSTETDFTNYHCMFLTTAYETLNKLLTYYVNTCSIT